MTWQDYLDLHEYWAQFPPVHVLAAGWMGYKPEVKSGIDKEINQDFAFEEIMSMFPVSIVPKGELNDG